MANTEALELDECDSKKDEVTKSKVERRKSPSSHVRFSDKQYSEITGAAERTRVSIPDLLKSAYFQGGALRVLMDRDLAKSWYTELQRWGNNLNQLTRKLNSGEYAGWAPELEQIATKIAAIQNMLMEVYGRS